MKSNEICNDIKSCSGCEACANICAHDAITMKPDWRGFLYPYVDVEKCVDCKLCQKVCPVNKENRGNTYLLKLQFILMATKTIFTKLVVEALLVLLQDMC